MKLAIGAVLIAGIMSGGSSAGTPFSKFCGRLDDRGRQVCCYVADGTQINCGEVKTSNNGEMRRIQGELLRRAEEARRDAEHSASPKE
jgi:hypothetical protein